MENISLEQWTEGVIKNCDSSYGLVISAAVLLLWEEDAVAKGNEKEVLTNSFKGLSGAQAVLAINYARQYKPLWLSK